MASNLKEIKTTIIGFVLFLIGVGITVYEYFQVEVIEWQHYFMPLGFTVAGIGFLAAPDRLLDFLFGWAKKKTGQ